LKQAGAVYKGGSESVHDEKKVSFSHLVNDDPAPGDGNMELLPEIGKSVEEEDSLSGVIRRELRVKDNEKQETEAFPPCVAHGLAVRMDVISQSLVRVQTDVADIKRDLARVFDQQDPGDNINNNNNKNKNKEQEWRDHSDDSVEKEEDNGDYNLSQSAPSQLDVMMMMLGQSNNIFYSRQPAAFFRSGSEAGCSIQPGPYCHRPITPPQQLVEISGEDDDINDINCHAAAASGSPPAASQMIFSFKDDCDECTNVERAEEHSSTVLTVD
jgi:hypothetical protein